MGFAGYSLDKHLGALCFLTPFAMLHSLSTLEELYFAFLEYIDTQQPFTPARILLICILILVAITIMSQPYQNNVPCNFLHLPFKPIQVTSFTGNYEEVALIKRSRSHQCLISRHAALAPLQANTLLRSPSHSTFLHGSPMPTDHLTDEEVNKRFSAFIKSRFAAMKREVHT